MEAGSEQRVTGSDAAAVQSEIERRLEEHAEALGERDVERCLRLYTERAVVRAANMEPVRGKDALRTFFTRWFEAMTIENGEYVTEELDVHEDRAYQIGTYSGTQVLRDGPAVPDRGSFHIVWERQADGSWRYHRGIFNSSLPVDETVVSKGDQ
jgi:ketosteroid isomerase-like protein